MTSSATVSKSHKEHVETSHLRALYAAINEIVDTSVTMQRYSTKELEELKGIIIDVVTTCEAIRFNRQIPFKQSFIRMLINEPDDEKRLAYIPNVEMRDKARELLGKESDDIGRRCS